MRTRNISHLIWRDEKRCAKCGKVFLAAPEHVYRKNSKWYCT